MQQVGTMQLTRYAGPKAATAAALDARGRPGVAPIVWPGTQRAWHRADARADEARCRNSLGASSAPADWSLVSRALMGRGIGHIGAREGGGQIGALLAAGDRDQLLRLIATRRYD
jgi:hypothetical protein